jgi:hypothetical protein
MSVQSLQNSLNGASLQTTNSIIFSGLVTLAQENTTVTWASLGLNFLVAPTKVIVVNNDTNWALWGVNPSYNDTNITVKQIPPAGEAFEIFNVQFIIYIA